MGMLLVAILILLGAIGSYYYNAQSTMKQYIGWENFATKNQLKFLSGFHANVNGSFNGYRIRLNSYKIGRGGLGTRARLYTREDNIDPGKDYHIISNATILNLLLPESNHFLPGKLQVKNPTFDNREFYYEVQGIVSSEQTLTQIFDALIDLARGYPVVQSMGSPVIPVLEKMIADNNSVFRNLLLNVEKQLITDIALDSEQRLGAIYTNLLCPHCLTRFGARKIQLEMWQSVTHYACWQCSQSEEYLSGRIIALLDNQTPTDILQEDGLIRLNWMELRQSFDFDEVEITHATDEDVERFAMQVGNDTDPIRRKRYPHMRCVISPECQLSENTLRILRHTFGEVVVV